MTTDPSGAPEQTLSPAQVLRWKAAIFAIFLTSGLSIATWASRVPAIKASLDIENAQVGALLLASGIASIVGLSTSSLVMARFGARRGMLTLMLVFAAGVAVVGLGTDLFVSYPVVMAGLILFGFGNGCIDVIMNVEATAIEQLGGKTILPLFHAFFSFGTVIGAGVGAALAGIGVNVLAHAASIAVLIVLIAIAAIANVPSRAQTDPDPAEHGAGWRERLTLALSAWREPRTYAIGVIMLGMAFAEGSANDWLALGVVEGHGGDEALGAFALTVFSVAMTAVRVFGGPLVDRFGRVWVLRALALTAAAGLTLFILAPNLPLALVGAALWGVGASLGFPLGMSAAADDPAKAAARVSAAATIGYVAFLAGPPILGVISDHIGLLNTLWIIVVLTIASGIASSAARPLRR
ncbi:MFS transporter [Microbacterium stercoris]|uniref:MFS transporter n=1 Tax=Microbacterium stercoris TaxID=2820289 RepID=A0A939QFW0_9MICO|nr:MFS transporter [Microbacterium stercoris]MBO3661998.1 MFS transporter [Microbacterium stercoris]